MVLPWQLVLKRSGEPKPAKSARKDTSTSFKRTLPCCLTSPLAVYAKTFSSSSIRNRFSKSAFWPKDYRPFDSLLISSPVIIRNRRIDPKFGLLNLSISGVKVQAGLYLDMLDADRSPNAVSVPVGTSQVDFEVDCPPPARSTRRSFDQHGKGNGNFV